MNTNIDFIGEKPIRAHKNDAGADLRAAYSTIIKPGERKLVGTGTFINIPAGWEGQVRSRSGLALKHGVFVLNSPGTIDHGYIGEIGVILYNSGEDDFHVSRGDRIAQLVIAKVELPEFIEVSSFEDTERGEGGFGSTGE